MYLIKIAEINEEIRDPEVRLIGAENEQLGVMSGKEALALAQEQKLDLVKIAPGAKPPVCKIMDFGKFRYEQQKKDKEAKKKHLKGHQQRLQAGPDKEDQRNDQLRGQQGVGQPAVGKYDFSLHKQTRLRKGGGLSGGNPERAIS